MRPTPQCCLTVDCRALRPFVDLEGTYEPETAEILIEATRFIGIQQRWAWWCRPLIMRTSLRAGGTTMLDFYHRIALIRSSRWRAGFRASPAHWSKTCQNATPSIPASLSPKFPPLKSKVLGCLSRSDRDDVSPLSNRGSFCKPLLQPCPLFDRPEARSGCRGALRPDSFRWPRSAGAVRGMQPLAAARISARPLTTPSAVAVPYLPVQMQFAIRCRDRVRKVTHAHKERRGHNMTRAPSRRPWHALLDIDGYLRSQSSWLTNYTKRYRVDLRVGTSITEGTANFLVNRRMNKSQQMRWSRSGANLQLQVRCAVYNGTRGSGFGHRSQPHANQNERSAGAA